MVRDNDRKFDYSKYIMYAIVLAFVSFLFLNVLVKVLIIVFNVLVKYYWATLILILLLIVIKKRSRKK